MTIKPAVLDAMLAAGVTTEQLVQILKADQAAQEADDEARRVAKREANTERQRRKRLRDKAPIRDVGMPVVTPVTRDAALQGTEERDTPSPSPDGPLSLPHTPTLTPLNPPSASPDSCPKPGRLRTPNDEVFEEFWKRYPRDANMSRREAWEAWRRLSEADRRVAVASIPGFLAYCQAHPDYRPIHANRYLLKHRFDGHCEAPAGVATHVWVQDATPQWEAWCRHSLARGETAPPALESRHHTGKGRFFPTEWPSTGTYLEAAE